MVRASILPVLTAALLASCGRPPVDMAALMERSARAEEHFHAARQMLDLRRGELDRLDLDREQLTKEINALRAQSNGATVQIKEVRVTYELNDQDLPLDSRVPAKGMELGDVQVGSMSFPHAVVKAWDGDLLTFTYEDGIGRVRICDTQPAVQALMYNAKPSGPRQPLLVINPGISEEPVMPAVVKPPPPAKHGVQSTGAARYASRARRGH